MARQALTVLTCDSCEAAAEAHDWDTTAEWMATHGWQYTDNRDLCPSCLVDQSAEARTS